MNATETARICDAISQIKPAQRFDTETPAFWAVILGDIRYEDARQAVLNLGGRQQFIDPSDIITEVRRIRDDRVDRTEMPVPNASPDDPAGYAVEYRALRLAIADGTLAGDRLEAYRRGEISLTGRPVLTGPLSPPAGVCTISEAWSTWNCLPPTDSAGLPGDTVRSLSNSGVETSKPLSRKAFAT